MKADGTPEARVEQLAHQLDDLASRATRAVAELRNQSQSVLDDVARWQQQLDLGRVDAELARMDARDELQRAGALLQARRTELALRLDEARADAVDALRNLRDGLDSTFHDFGRSLGIVHGDVT